MAMTGGLLMALFHPHWLVGGFNPSEKYESIGMMTFPIYRRNKSQVPNHQPVEKLQIHAICAPTTQPRHEVRRTARGCLGPSGPEGHEMTWGNKPPWQRSESRHLIHGYIWNTKNQKFYPCKCHEKVQAKCQIPWYLKASFQVPSSEGFTGLAATLINTCPPRHPELIGVSSKRSGRLLVVGGMPTSLKKNISQLGLLFPLYGETTMIQTTNRY